MITIRGTASYIIHSPSKENSLMYTYFLIVIYLKNLCSPVLIKSCFENTLNWKQWTTSLLNSPAREHFSVTFHLCKPIKKFFLFLKIQKTAAMYQNQPCVKTSNFSFFNCSAIEGSWDHWSRGNWILQMSLK